MTRSGSFSLQQQRAGGWCEPERNNEPVAYEPSGWKPSRLVGQNELAPVNGLPIIIGLSKTKGGTAKQFAPDVA